MKTPRIDVDSLIDALRDDLPSERDEARVRARLIAAGVVATSALASSSVAAATASSVSSVSTGVSVATGASVAGGTTAGATVGPAVLGSASGGSAGALAVAQVGIWSKVIALPVAAKIGVLTTVALGVAAGASPALRELGAPAREVPLVVAQRSADHRSTNATAEQLAPLVTAHPEAADAPRVEEAAVVLAVPSSVAPAARPPSRPLVLPTARSSRVLHSQASRPSPSSGAVVSESSLAEETSLLERAIAALREDDTEQARFWLTEHGRRFPDGLLVRERQRALERAERQTRSVAH